MCPESRKYLLGIQTGAKTKINARLMMGLTHVRTKNYNEHIRTKNKQMFMSPTQGFNIADRERRYWIFQDIVLRGIKINKNNHPASTIQSGKRV